jgi:uncharacterized Zn-finger protein
MSQKIKIDGVEYDFESLSPVAKDIIEKLQHTETQIQDKQNLSALLTRSKNSYIHELKREMVEGKSGVDIASLFD